MERVWGLLYITATISVSVFAFCRKFLSSRLCKHSAHTSADLCVDNLLLLSGDRRDDNTVCSSLSHRTFCLCDRN